MYSAEYGIGRGPSEHPCVERGLIDFEGLLGSFLDSSLEEKSINKVLVYE